jgi:hypothetical protein
MTTLKDYYESIKDVEDEFTRLVLYRQFIQKYFPIAYNVIIKGKEK